MTAVFRRELCAYFYSPIGYIFLAVFYFFAGIFFFFGPLLGSYSDLGTVFSGLYAVLLFLIPILTMRIVSEDLRHKTDQLLLCAPVSLSRVVLGKYLAAVAIFLFGLLITLVFALVISAFTPPGWAAFWGSFFSTLLLGMAMISIGMLISALTENQMIAAAGGFAAGMLLLIIDSLAGVFPNPVVVKIFMALSFYDRYYSFHMGIFDLSSVIFFLSVCAVFVFLTIRVLEKRRWG